MNYNNFFKNLLYFTLLIVSITSCGPTHQGEKMTLAGEWNFAMDKDGVGKSEKWFNNTLSDVVLLPGTMDENEKGILNCDSTESRFLARKYSYLGAAWYGRTIEIPTAWKNRKIELFIERTKPSEVWIDGKYVGKNLSVSTPHIYDITEFVKDGKKHNLSVLIDNGTSKLPANVFNSHIGSEHTQTCWNGMVGKIELRVGNKTSIKNLKVYPRVSNGSARFNFKIENPELNKGKYSVDIQCFLNNDSHSTISMTYPINSKKEINIKYPMGDNIELWDEFNQNLYRCEVTLKCNDEVIDVATTTIGMRNFEAKDLKLYNNGKRVFLRGRHDACVFPLTGYAPMDEESWAKYYAICKDYGLNHVRFHSWCPPKAAFEAADKAGFYLQIELPLWGTVTSKDTESVEYLKKEASKIIENYSNHPSLVMLALGNELKGDTTKLEEVVKSIKSERQQLLCATGSNNFLGTKGAHSADDFAVTCRIGGLPTDPDYRAHVRASFSFVDAPEGGIINNTTPNSRSTFASAFKNATVPVIGHETGQYQAYPNFQEMEKYKGILEPRNLQIFKDRLQKAGMLKQANDFFRASGALQALLYKADIEMNLRTSEISGFQLLDLQDYPGQGTALVGILDASMDSKGFITPEKWRSFCAPVVPLLAMDKFIYKSGEVFEATALISNYSNKDINGEKLKWRIFGTKGKELKSGTFNIDAREGELTQVGTLNFTLPDFEESQMFKIAIFAGENRTPNIYRIWIYPNFDKKANLEKFSLVQSVDNNLYSKLENGETVLFMPKKEALQKQTVGGLFTTDYWNYRMFKQISLMKKAKVSPGTLGLLINQFHPIFKNFPTSYHTDMQWYSIVKNSRPLIMDLFPTFEQPLVQVIDNVERNHKLGLIFECKVGKGKLLVCMSDLKAIDNHPEAAALYNSITSYISSEEFDPSISYTTSQLKKVLTTPIRDKELGDLENVSYSAKKNNK